MSTSAIGIFYNPLGNPGPNNPYRCGVGRMISAAQDAGYQARLFVPVDADRRALPTGDYQAIRCPTTFTNVAAVTQAFLTVHREVPMARIFGPQECTVELAAACRAAAGIPGIQPDVAARFRDKHVMSRAAAAIGLRVAQSHAVTTFEAVRAFGDHVGWPLIVKPFNAAGAEGVLRVDSAQALAELWPTLAANPHQWRIEEFIAGTEYHVDSIVHGGEVVFVRLLRYLQPLLTFRVYPPGSVIRRHDLSAGERAILDMNAAVAGGFGLEHGVMHNEFFVDARRDAVFSEAAARVGGGHAVATIEAATGLNIYDAMVRTELDQTYHPVALRDEELGGQLLPASHSGRITSIIAPQELAQEGVFNPVYWYGVGDHLEIARRSTRMFGLVLAAGENLAQIMQQLRRAVTRFHYETVADDATLGVGSGRSAQSAASPA